MLTLAEPDPEPVGRWPLQRMFGPDGDPEDFLEALVAPVRDRGRQVATYVKYDPVGPTAGVRSYLTEHPARLAVLGSHARTGIKRLVAGGVTGAVVRGSPSPVLVVPRLAER